MVHLPALSRHSHLHLLWRAPQAVPHHAARLDMMLWRGLKDAALMEPLVSEDRRKLAAARRAA